MLVFYYGNTSNVLSAWCFGLQKLLHFFHTPWFNTIRPHHLQLHKYILVLHNIVQRLYQCFNTNRALQPFPIQLFVKAIISLVDSIFCFFLKKKLSMFIYHSLSNLIYLPMGIQVLVVHHCLVSARKA